MSMQSLLKGTQLRQRESIHECLMMLCETEYKELVWSDELKLKLKLGL